MKGNLFEGGVEPYFSRETYFSEETFFGGIIFFGETDFSVKPYYLEETFFEEGDGGGQNNCNILRENHQNSDFANLANSKTSNL